MKLYLKEVRKNADVTQQQLADALGVSLATVGNWERGVTYPDAEQVWRCAEALGCTPNDIFGWTPRDAPRDSQRDELDRIWPRLGDGARGTVLDVARIASDARGEARRSA